MDLDSILQELADKGGSDLHVKANRPPMFRISGDLVPSDYPELTETEITQCFHSIMTDDQIASFEKDCEMDFGYTVAGLARFRVNVFKQRQLMGAVLRLIPAEVPTIEAMGLPDVLNDIADHINGLVIVTGPTGSGKSTTLASMVEHINRTRPLHLVTIEDPIEFVYEDKISTINQRELGLDTMSFDNALRAVLRQDPDCLLMGEMRDRKTIEFALHAAETGHLVFSTLHTNDAKQSIDRILDMFPTDAQKQIRVQLALQLRGIVCQRLCKRADGTGRVASLEIMINTTHISQLIEEGATRDLEKAIENSAHYKMQTFNMSLYDLVQKGLISEDEAIEKSSNREDLRLMMRGIRRGTSTTEFDQDMSNMPGSPGVAGSSDSASSVPEKKKPKFGKGFDF